MEGVFYSWHSDSATVSYFNIGKQRCVQLLYLYGKKGCTVGGFILYLMVIELKKNYVHVVYSGVRTGMLFIVEL